MALVAGPASAQQAQPSQPRSSNRAPLLSNNLATNPYKAGDIATAPLAVANPNASPLVMDLNKNPVDGTYLSAGHAGISLCPTVGCNPGHLYASLLTQMTTVGDGTRQESGHYINVTNSTGYRSAINSIDNGVEGLSIAMSATAEGAQSWGQATDLVLRSGWHSDFAATSELDLTNDAYDCPPGSKGPDGHPCNVFGQWISGYVGAHRSTVAIFVSPSGGRSGFAHHSGLAFEGAKTVKDATVVDGTNANTSIEIAGNHAAAVIHDRSTSPVAFNAQGSYSYSAFTTITADAPVAFAAKAGQTVCFSGKDKCVSYDSANDSMVFTSASGGRIASLNMTTGNMVLKGTLTQNGRP